MVDSINRETLIEIPTNFRINEAGEAETSAQNEPQPRTEPVEESEVWSEAESDNLYHTDAGHATDYYTDYQTDYYTDAGPSNTHLPLLSDYILRSPPRSKSTRKISQVGSLARQRRRRRFSTLPYSVMTSNRGLSTVDPIGAASSVEGSPLSKEADSDLEDVSSDDDLEAKTHAPPKPIFLGVPKGEASKSLLTVWQKDTFPKARINTNWRANMERMIASPASNPSSVPNAVSSPIKSRGLDQYLSSGAEGAQSTLRHSVHANTPSISSQRSNLQNTTVYDTWRSRESTTSYASSTAPSFVTAHESLESPSERNDLSSRVSMGHNSEVMERITSEDSYDTAENNMSTLPEDVSPHGSVNTPQQDLAATPIGDVSRDYESTIRPERSTLWRSSYHNGEPATSQEESNHTNSTPEIGTWGPPLLEELSDIGASEDSDVPSFVAREPARASRKSRRITITERRSLLSDRINQLAGLNTGHRKHNNVVDLSLRRFLKHKQKGEVLRVEKLLVMVKGCKAQFINPEFNEVEKLETRVLERWKEYVVVARNTGDINAPIALQFYNSRNIAKVDAEVAKSVSKIDVKLTSDMYVKFYSTLDKTIALWRSSRKGSLIYILRARSHESSLRWLALFRRALGVKQTPKILLGVPNLGITVDIVLPWNQIYREQAKQNAIKKDEQLISYQDMKSSMYRATPILSYIYAAVIQGLSGIDHLKDEVAELIRCEKMGLAWRRYDRLEWIDENNEEGIYCSWVLRKTHDLEFRPKKSYPTVVTFEDGVEMEEPIPVEGYLVRLTRWLGSGIRHQRRHRFDVLFYKKLYFHTHDNILFFSQPDKAVPPHPSSDYSGEEPSADGAASSLLAYEVAPFRTNGDGEIEWLQGNSNEEEVKRHDRAALYETQRRVSMIVSADGFIDLCEIDCIRPVERNLEETDQNIGTENDESLKSCFTTDSSNSGEISTFDDSTVFEIVMLSGTIIRLQAYNEHNRDLWIMKLTELSKYWKRHVYEDVARINEVRQANLERLHVDEDIEPFVGEANPKWETSSGLASPSVYHISRLAWSRSISMRGILYQKATKHSSFRRYYVILCHGHLILYSVYYRSPTGDAKHRADHRRYQSIALDNCYVYSGPITLGDLLVGRERWFDRTNPGSHAIPRVYPDGWKSAEDESYRCFVLWFGKKRPVTNKKEKTVRLINRLGVQGTSMVFLARSRQERDLWVLALNYEIERVVESATQDINIVT